MLSLGNVKINTDGGFDRTRREGEKDEIDQREWSVCVREARLTHKRVQFSAVICRYTKFGGRKNYKTEIENSDNNIYRDIRNIYDEMSEIKCIFCCCCSSSSSSL